MLTIGKLAEAGGVGVETIRFYQRKELLPVPVRDGGIRRYDRGPAAASLHPQGTAGWLHVGGDQGVDRAGLGS